MSNITALQSQHSDAKEALKQARAAHGKDSAEAKEAKKAVDRLYQAIRRASKNGNGNAPTAPAQPEADGTATDQEATVPATAEKPKATRKSGAKKGGKKAAAAKRSATDFAEPHVLGEVVTPKDPAKIKVLDRTPKGNKVRACRKNRETGTHIALIDAKLDRRFKAENGRWVTLEEESGEAAQHATWEGACFYARIPSTWSEHSRSLVEQS